MKRSFPLIVLGAVVAFFATTGFQCGSAEVTSAKLYIQQKQWDKAEQSLMKELAKNDKNEEAWFLLGQVRNEARNYPGMNEAFVRALQISDAHKTDIQRYRLATWALLYNDGVAAYNKGRDSSAMYDLAITDFTTAITLVPDSATTYYVASLAYFAKKDKRNTIDMLNKAVERNPSYLEAALFLAQIHYNEGIESLAAKDSTAAMASFGKAAGAFEIAYKADPARGEAITGLIDVYERLKQSDKALKLTVEAVQREPNNKLYRYAYGVFLLKQDQFAQSVEQFSKAVEIDPTYTDAVYNLGVAYLNWGVAMKVEADKAAEAAGRGAKEDKAYQEKFKLAIPHLEKAAETRPDDALLWQQLGKIYANLNMQEKSKAAFEKFDQIMKNK